MTTGVYLLAFENTDKVYIGQSLNIERRMTGHISKFKRGIHTAKLQEAYNVYGTPTLHILEECDSKDLDKNESIYIDEFNSYYEWFNTAARPGGGCSLKGEDAGNSKYSNLDIEIAFLYLVNSPDLTSAQISKLVNVSKYTIDAISSGKVHLWLEDIYLEEYTRLSNRGTNRAKNKTLADIGNNYPRLVSPTGVAYTICNCAEFSRLHNLNNSHVIQVLKGKEQSHKGWRAENKQERIE